MSYFRPLIDPTRQAMAGHLGRLGLSLASLGRHLRDSVAGAIGRAASEAVRQAVTTLLRQPGEDSAPEESWTRYRNDRVSSTWNRDHFRHHDPWNEPGESGWGYGDRWQHEDEEPSERYSDEEPANPTKGGWRWTLAALCRMLAWLLGRIASPGAGWFGPRRGAGNCSGGVAGWSDCRSWFAARCHRYSGHQHKVAVGRLQFEMGKVTQSDHKVLVEFRLNEVSGGAVQAYRGFEVEIKYDDKGTVPAEAAFRQAQGRSFFLPFGQDTPFVQSMNKALGAPPRGPDPRRELPVRVEPGMGLSGPG
jgi:hypothetical protein